MKFNKLVHSDNTITHFAVGKRGNYMITVIGKSRKRFSLTFNDTLIREAIKSYPLAVEAAERHDKRIKTPQSSYQYDQLQSDLEDIRKKREAEERDAAVIQTVFKGRPSIYTSKLDRSLARPLSGGAFESNRKKH